MFKVIQREIGPIPATFFLVALATLFLIPMTRREGQQSQAREYPRSFPTRDIRGFLLLGAFGMAGPQLLIIWGVRLSLASNAALVTLTLPVTTAVMAYFFLGERMTAVRWASFTLAIVGVLQCSGIEWRALNFKSAQYFLGNTMVFLGICGNSFYNVYSKKLLLRYSPLQIVLYSYAASSAILLLAVLCVEPEGLGALLHLSPVAWLCLLAVSLMVMCVAMVIYLHVLKRLDATQAGLSNYLISFFGVLMAVAILHERLTKSMVLGGILVLAATLLVTVCDKSGSTDTLAAVSNPGNLDNPP